MKRGQKQARNADVNTLKKNILDWIFPESKGTETDETDEVNTPAISRFARLGNRPANSRKELRGFENEAIAELLRPVDSGPLTPE